MLKKGQASKGAAEKGGQTNLPLDWFDETSGKIMSISGALFRILKASRFSECRPYFETCPVR